MGSYSYGVSNSFASEDYLVKNFEAAQLNAIYGKPITIKPKDMKLSKRQRQIFDGDKTLLE
jgi:histone H3/H4